MLINRWMALPSYTSFALAALLIFAAVPSLAFDGTTSNPTSGQVEASQQVSKYASPQEAFEFGLRDYYDGDKQAAIAALEAAAQQGHAIAQWKLGRMYAIGDGVPEDDLKAFKLFSQIANEHAEDQPNSQRAPFVSDAFVALGDYYLNGIADSAVTPNVDRARRMFQFAASYFRDPEAQFRLGRMYHSGEGGPQNEVDAARWLNLSAQKGHIQAQFELGLLLWRGNQDVPRMPVAGLKWLTIALTRCRSQCPEYENIRASHERAFMEAGSGVRREAYEQAQGWLRNKDAIVQR